MLKENNLPDRIRKANADVVLVALGHVKQEQWIIVNKKNLPTVRVAMGVGGSFDFIAGEVKRAPQSFQNRGVEWLWRLFRQPWRVPRILTATFKFTNFTVRYKLKAYDRITS